MRSLSLFVLVLALVMLGESASALAQQRTVTFVNRCNETVWVGALGNPGHAIPNGGGWRFKGRQAGRKNSGQRGHGYAYLHHAVDDHSRLA